MWVPYMEFPASLVGRKVKVRATSLKPEYRTDDYLIVQATGGFGCNPSAMGSAVFIKYLSGPEAGQGERYERRMIEAVWCDETDFAEGGVMNGK